MPRITVVGFQVQIGLSQSCYLMFVRCGTIINEGADGSRYTADGRAAKIPAIYSHAPPPTPPLFFPIYKAITEAINLLFESWMMKPFM